METCQRKRGVSKLKGGTYQRWRGTSQKWKGALIAKENGNLSKEKGRVKIKGGHLSEVKRGRGTFPITYGKRGTSYKVKRELSYIKRGIWKRGHCTPPPQLFLPISISLSLSLSHTHCLTSLFISLTIKLFFLIWFPFSFTLSLSLSRSLSVLSLFYFKTFSMYNSMNPTVCTLKIKRYVRNIVFIYFS